MSPFIFRADFKFGKMRLYPLCTETRYIVKAVAHRECLTLDEVEGLSRVFDRQVTVKFETHNVTMSFDGIDEFKAYAPKESK